MPQFFHFILEKLLAKDQNSKPQFPHIKWEDNSCFASFTGLS